ncbi:MAG TPA: hypothetical protein VH087_04260 [Thermoanaerobaculia bacterium]|jgi:hypothetical protein|nr:hypothetical protein [Thermoanaerobaculia bacterium]HEX3580951.1 hypothetical protein [Thermoanaerobaculia bacterium]
MRTITTKSFTIALILSIALAVPTFADREDAKRQPRGGDQQQQTIVQKLINRVVHIFDLPIIIQPVS